MALEREHVGKDSASTLELVEWAAARGSKGAAEVLADIGDEPDYPDDAAYLMEWAEILHGRSGAGFGTFLPLSHQEILAWAILEEIDVTPLEVEALRLLDAAMFVSKDKPAEEPEDRKKKPQPAWPTKKVS